MCVCVCACVCMNSELFNDVGDVDVEEQATTLTTSDLSTSYLTTLITSYFVKYLIFC